MKIQVISLFPEMFPGVMNASMLWKAQDKKLASIEYINLRDFGLGQRRTVDDTPYGGGDGMLLKPEPLFAAIEHAKKRDPTAKVLLPTPRGVSYVQSTAQRLSKEQGLIIVCARYEGYDERVTSIVDEQISIGNYVLTGGELPGARFRVSWAAKCPPKSNRLAMTPHANSHNIPVPKNSKTCACLMCC